MIALLLLVLSYDIATADPTPNGGAPCNTSRDCGNGGGYCELIGNISRCLCDKQHGAPDCSYERKSKQTAGWVQIGLSLIGIFGTGNFYLGHIGAAVGQLIMGFSVCVIGCLAGCISCGAAACCKLGDGAFEKGSISWICIICIVASSVAAGFSWSLADGIIMLTKECVDANGFHAAN